MLRLSSSGRRRDPAAVSSRPVPDNLFIKSSSKQVFIKASLHQSKSSSKQVARRFAAAFNNHLIVSQNNVPGATDPIWMTNDARR
jgi:hypothetical protein